MIEQGSAEWLALRLGNLTASRMAEATARTKSGWGASRKNLMAELLVERLTGVATVSYINAAMQWGLDHEEIAADAYEFERNVALDKIAHFSHPTIKRSGASPDRVSQAGGLVQIKCPNTAQHVDVLLNETIDGGYIKQMQWEMACSGLPWCDFVSFDPRVPLEMQLYIHRVERNEKMIAALEADAIKFLHELDAMEAALRSKFGLQDAA